MIQIITQQLEIKNFYKNFPILTTQNSVKQLKTFAIHLESNLTDSFIQKSIDKFLKGNK
jgi:hypothetical protein